MKESVKILSVLLFSLVSFVTYAQKAGPAFAIQNAEAKSFYLNLEDLPANAVQVRIQDQNETVLFSELVRATTSRFERKYHLENLQEGTYFLIIEEESMVWVQPLILQKTELLIESASLQKMARSGANLKISMK